jgi:hypothetical protein
VPLIRIGLCGVIVIVVSGVFETVSRVVPERLVVKSVAMMMVVPAAIAVTRPFMPVGVPTVAMPGSDELQDTQGVTLWVVSFGGSVAVAENKWVVPTAILGLYGAAEMATGMETVSVVAPEIPLVTLVAVMTVVPVASEVTRPFASIVATEVFDELQMQKLAFILMEVPSENDSVGVNCCVVVRAMTELAGVKVIAVIFPLPLQPGRTGASAENRATTNMQDLIDLIMVE